MKIGIFGGTFDPIHNDHISLARTAKKELGLDLLYIVPAYVSPLKAVRTSTSPIDRMNMLKLVFNEDDEEISDFEIKKGGQSFTFETVLYFKKLHKKDQLYLIIGGDSLSDFDKWKNPDVITQNAEIVACDRETNYTDFEKESKRFKKNFGKNFIKLTYSGSELSSTKVRMYSSFSLPLEGLVPENVANYIAEKNLYKSNPYFEYLKENLPQDRLIHTANVVVASLKKGQKLGLSYEKIVMASSLHDMAKYIDPDTVDGFKYKGIPRQVVHAYLGAYLMETNFGITDKDVLDAVRYHTTAKAPMTTLGKLIFVADMIEAGRKYDGVDELRKTFYTKSIDEAFVDALKEEISHITAKGYELFTETINAYNYYIKKGGKN